MYYTPPAVAPGHTPAGCQCAAASMQEATEGGMVRARTRTLTPKAHTHLQRDVFKSVVGVIIQSHAQA